MYRKPVIVILLLFAINVFAQDTIATELLNHVNLARQDAGLEQLYFNLALQATAQQHSDDMASVDRLSHTGTDGSQFWERMQSNDYLLIAGAENILSRGDSNPESAFRQWLNSEPHRLNMLNTDYQEVGIAYARAESGRFYFTMVFGARTDFVVPTAIPTNTPIPTDTAIPPTLIPTETIPATPTITPTMQASSTAIPVATSTPGQLPVTNTPIPTETEYIPPDIRLIYDNNSFLLINVSGSVLNLSNLFFESDSGSMSSLRWNTEFLSQPLSGFTNGDCLQVWTVNVNYLITPDDCRYRHAWIAVANDASFWRQTEIFTVRNGENIVGICQVDAEMCEVNLSTPIEDITVIDPVTFGQLPDLRLEYLDNSFTLINVSGRTLDLSGLVFRNESEILSIEAWDNGFLSQSLTAFDDGGCLQVWTFDYPEQPAPERCQIRHAWILIGDDRDFWRQTDNFTIEHNNRVIGRCFTDETNCSISLTANLP